ncbi:MAG TPA: hypothetical protein DHV36_08335, partial [Desulfobacteraceae bacterium]|nr:hypothetical protein [Desulfobacteraceae bacterium]
WPGNVRELAHIIEGGLNLMDQETIIRTRHLPAHMGMLRDRAQDTGPQHTDGPIPNRHPAVQGSSPPPPPVFPMSAQTRENEISMIREALGHTRGKPSAAARRLGISPQLLNYKLNKYGIDRHAFT